MRVSFRTLCKKVPRSSIHSAYHRSLPSRTSLQPGVKGIRSPALPTTRLLLGPSRLFKTCAVVAAPTSIADAEMVAKAPTTIYRKNYSQTPYLVEDVYLDFHLNEDETTVKSDLQIRPNYSGSPPEMSLDGRSDVKLVSVAVNGKVMSESDYQLTDKKLILKTLPEGEFKLSIETVIKPQENTMLEGLYKSGGNFCTQCEAEGFRGITYFYDRPDVMSKYIVRVEAEKAKYPQLLSNGNLIDSGDMGSRHFATWQDPFPKPCYLFALVAGDLAGLKDTFTTKSGKEVKLCIWVQKEDLPKTEYAMASLKQAMKWDEDVFGLEYHLEKFDVVCMADFNMGAMENTSLNIFNSRLVLASPATATDLDYARIEGVIGHEYFHNWTGNRVTCRDWFQLTLKEGLTVFRDQEFSADMNSRAVKRIEDVSRLRQAQFPEDAGSMAHPIRPDSYVRMDNFYSATVYEKGAEVIRLYHTLLGAEGFRKGMDLYFKRHDGQAVTCDDFRAAMADANSSDLSGLEPWYAQAGTPQVTLDSSYNSSDHTLSITATQQTPATPGQEKKVPVLVPIRIALLASSGNALPLHTKDAKSEGKTETVLRLEKASQTFTFSDVQEKPILSVLRNFSAPVKLEVKGQTEQDLIFLLAHDTDSFSKWEASQALQRSLILRLYDIASKDAKEGDITAKLASEGGIPQALLDAFSLLLKDESIDPALTSAAVSLPAASELLDAIHEANPVTLHQVRKYVTKQLAQNLRKELEQIVARFDASLGAEYSPDAESVAKRTLKNKALQLLSSCGDPAITQDLLARFRGASNMTDEIAALGCLIDAEGSERETALKEFYQKWQTDGLVVLKWLALIAGSNVPGNVEAVKSLTQHEAFNIKNPNNCYSVFLGFCRSHPNFHAEDGSGYRFLADSIITVDKINRSVAARMAGAFTQWKQLDKKRQGMIKEQLKRIVDEKDISENVFEVASKSL